MKHKKRKPVDLYLTNEDIEKLHDRYEELFKQVKNSQDLTPAQIEKECDVLSRKYDFEIEDLSRFREAEFLKRQAEIKAKNAEQIPWRRSWLWRLLFMPLTNRAQDIIELKAQLDAEDLFAPMEKELDDRADKLYKKLKPSTTVESASGTAAQATQESGSTAAHGTSDAAHQSGAGNVAEPPEPPARKPRKAKQAGA